MDEQTKQLETKIQAQMGRILLWGMLASSAIVLMGGILFLIQFGSAHANYTSFDSVGSHIKTVGAVIRGIRDYSGGALIEAGILLLVVFQYIRVIMSAVMFARLRSWFFVGVSLFILAVLVYGLFF
ncbi:MAG TPA: DUF1634 domain-containing protein [Spirochaetia bacterium]|nr:DUF1634 domain-containing protein [Spirochaetia bacterium]